METTYKDIWKLTEDFVKQIEELEKKDSQRGRYDYGDECIPHGYEKGAKPITNKPTSLDKLVDVLTTFCNEEGLEHMCADDLLHTSNDLNDYQRSTLSLYSQLFTVVASREGES